MRLLFDGTRATLDLSSPELRLTPEQRRAMATDRELLVVAGAGTGKTHTLAMRYVALLLELANQGEQDVERVLVLTFTEKAAAEMAERCHQQLRALCAYVRDRAAEWDAQSSRQGGKAVGSRLAAALSTMEDHFDRARISTFHSFCARLLHEFPGATRTPPGTRPLPAGESARWMERALEEALDDWLARHPQDIEPLLDTFGSRMGLLEAGQVALSRLGLLDELLSRHARGEVTIDRQLAAASPDPASAARWTEEVGLPTLQLLKRLVAPSGGGSFVQTTLLPALERLEAPLPEGESQGEADEPLRIYARYRAVLELLLNDQGLVRRLDHPTVLGVRASWPDDRRYTQAKEAAKALQARIAGSNNDWHERARKARRLPTLADRAMLEALVPFSRWVKLASERLRRLFAQHRVVSFEEMQRRAVEAVTTSPAVRARLREQFRYLMVDEFQDTDEPQWALVRALGREDPAVPEDRIFLVGDPKQAIYGFRGGDPTVFRRALAELGGQPLSLLDNFRSTPALIGWYNELFPSVLHKDTRYEPLRANRPEPGVVPTLIRCGEKSSTDVCAEMTARAIAHQLGPGSPWLDRERYPTPPIALLLRSRTRQGRYEAALRRHGIPYVVVSGLGLWTRPEVLDLVNAIAAVAHGDPRSIVGYLRSPLGGLDDDAIARFCAGSPPTTPEERAAAQRFRRWRQRGRHVPALTLLREVVEEMIPSLAVADSSGRALHNARKVVEIAAGWGTLSLPELADRLVAEAESATREAEVDLVPTEARVVVCTVHASKGLEFPVVVVADLSSRARATLPPLLVGRTDEGELALASRVLDPDASVQTRVEPGRWSTLKAVLRADEDAEERRLLYVAVTRARDRLLLVGNAPPPLEPGARPTWMHLLEEALPPRTEVLSEVAPPPPLGLERPSRPPPTPTPARSMVAAQEIEVRASTLDAFQACPARWMRAEWLKIPEIPGSEAERERAAERALAEARAKLLRELLEQGVQDEEPDGLELRHASAVGALHPSPRQQKASLALLRAHLAALRRSRSLRQALSAPGFSRLSFRERLGGIALTGSIDRLWLDRGHGGFVVLDWECEALGDRSPEILAQRRALQRLAYGWAADRVLRERSQPGVVRGEAVLTETGAMVGTSWTERDLQGVPLLLEQIAEITALPWEEVERRSTREGERPCAECGYRGRGCRGAA